MSNFDFTKTLLNGSKKYIDERVNSIPSVYSWNELEDRPFGSQVSNTPIEITWDGDRTGKPILETWTETGYCYLGNYGITHYDNLLGGTVVWGGNTYTLDSYGESPSGAFKGYAVYPSENSRAEIVINIEQVEVDYPVGLYVYYQREEYVSYIKTPSFEREEIIALDSKYLPKPLQIGEYIGEVDIIPTTGFSFSDVDGVRCSTISGLVDQHFMIGKSYSVYFDGELYENLTCYDNNGNPTLGDISQHPFCIYTYADGYDIGVYVQISNTYSYSEIRVTTIGEKIKTLSTLYLPPIIGIKGTGDCAEIFNDASVASGDYSHAEGRWTEAKGDHSHAEGHYSQASGSCSHAEGYQTEASGAYSHAEGDNTEASGNTAHAEGKYTNATGEASHAEGDSTIASGKYSHAEGWETAAQGYGSHAEGHTTYAKGEFQHVQGKYNIHDVDTDGNALNTYAHIVGNGTSWSNKSNAHTLDWQGNAEFAGDVKANACGGENPISLVELNNKVNEMGSEGVSSWNDLKDKPFYGDSEVLLEWDGDRTGLDMSEGSDWNEYRIGNNISYEDMVGATIYLSDSTSIKVKSEDLNIYDSAWQAYFSTSGGYISIANVPEDFSTKYSKPGLYHSDMSDTLYVTKIEKGDIVKLPEKYLPEHSHVWNDLTDKPFEEKTTMSDTLTWDGKHDGSYDIFVPYSEYYFVSDVSLSEEELLSGEFKCVLSTGTVNEFKYEKRDLYTNDLTYDHLYTNGYVGVVTSESTTHTPGIYLYHSINRDTMSDEEYVTSFTYKGHNVFKTVEVTPIDSKYLYDTILDFGDQSVSIDNSSFDYSKVSLIGSNCEELITKLQNGKVPKVAIRYNYVYGDYVYKMTSESLSVNYYIEDVDIVTLIRGYDNTGVFRLEMHSDGSCSGMMIYC